uniref:TF-B3 domain-containing protein n=1 Tax=Cannabis sativa TaxID=3483 RepID=A0A803QFL5_CANSA
MEERTNLRLGNEVKMQSNHQFMTSEDHVGKLGEKLLNCFKVIPFKCYSFAFVLVLLALPIKFVKLYGDSLASFASLVLPCGHTWKIGLVRRDNKIFLQKEWPKFVQHYGIIKINSHLLIFDYRGNSKFDVSITDETSCEIDYTHFPFHSDGKKIDKAPVIRLTSSEECSSNSDSDSRLPNSFIKSHLGSKTQIISLKVGSRKWDVKLLNCECGFFFSKGWAAFLEANSVNTGDACIFEFVSREQASLKVSIIRNNRV